MTATEIAMALSECCFCPVIPDNLGTSVARRMLTLAFSLLQDDGEEGIQPNKFGTAFPGTCFVEEELFLFFSRLCGDLCPTNFELGNAKTMASNPVKL